MSYGKDGFTDVNQQNIMMNNDAGTVIWETESEMAHTANFSCCQACLF